MRIAAEPPQFIEEPLPLMKAARGRTAVLTCRVFGAPKPTVVWQKGINEEDVEGYIERRFIKLANDDLEIQVSAMQVTKQILYNVPVPSNNRSWATTCPLALLLPTLLSGKMAVQKAIQKVNLIRSNLLRLTRRKQFLLADGRELRRISRHGISSADFALSRRKTLTADFARSWSSIIANYWAALVFCVCSTVVFPLPTKDVNRK